MERVDSVSGEVCVTKGYLVVCHIKDGSVKRSISAPCIRKVLVVLAAAELADPASAGQRYDRNGWKLCTYPGKLDLVVM